MSNVNIAVVDDHDGVRQVLVDYLAKQPNLTLAFETCDPDELESRLLRAPVDLLLLDIGMPGFNAVTTVRALKERLPAMRILIVSAQNSHVYASLLIEAGIDGYWVKTEALETLGKAVRAVSEGRPWFSRTVVAKDSGLIDPEMLALTKREREVLSLLAEGASEGQIAQTMFISPRTAQRHIKNILLKLGLDHWTEAVAWAQREGIIADHASHDTPG